MGKALEFHIDYHLVLFPYMKRKYNMNIGADRNKDTDDIIRFFTNTFAHLSGTVNLEAITFIEALQQRLEACMKKIISTKSIYYWFHLYRRIAPVATFDNESTQTVWLYRNILENAFLKYGKIETGNELIYSTGKRLVRVQDIANGLYAEALKHFGIDEKVENKCNGIFLGSFGKKELLEIYSLERMSYEFWHTTMCLRRIYKGGVLQIEKDQYWVHNDSETEFLMQSYDTRGGDLEDLSCSNGVSLITFDISKGIIIAPKYNIEQLSLQEYPQHKRFSLNMLEKTLHEFIPNFLWIPINLDYYYRDHEFYKDAFQKNFGYRMKSFVYTIFLLLSREYVFCRENRNAGIDCLKRAYRHIHSYEVLADELIEYYKAGKESGEYSFDVDKDEVLNVLKDLTLPKATHALSLVTLGPRYLLFPAINGDFIIDYAAIIPILMTKMHFLSAKKERKGHLFEDIVIERLRKKNFYLWECKKKLNHHDGTSKEIDLSFIYKGFLFIGELKSNKMSLSYIKGDIKSLEYRKKKMIDALSQIDDKAKWLSMHVSGTNYKIPEEVKAIIPFVVSPFKEYIWDRSSNLWITDLIPRICTPSECENLCSDEVIKSISLKPFTIHLV